MKKIRVFSKKGIFQKTKGLIGETTIYPILITTRFGIHTLGMKVPIDVVILDNTYRVKKIIEKLNPNRITVWNPKYSFVLELPQGEVKRLQITMNSQLLIEQIE